MKNKGGLIVEQEEKMETFDYSEMESGREHFYRITANENHFAIEKDGCIVADLVCDGYWKQTSGSPLPTNLISKLGDRIEDHYC